MAQTRTVTARVPESLEKRARASAPELAALDMSTLLRVGLAVLGGLPVGEALRKAQARPGPKPKASAAA
jgi:hypothetical protein